MLKLNKKAEYALIILKYMSQNGSTTVPVSAREICDQYKTPFDTVSKVMQLLNSYHILDSIKGINGGYIMTKKLHQINLKDILDLVSDPNLENFCQTKKGQCEIYSTCNISAPINILQQKYNHFLENINLKELLLQDK